MIMPVIGAITGGLDFSNYYLPLNAAVKTGLPLADAKKAGAVVAYGSFMIVAFVLFIAVQGINKMKRREESKPASPPAPTATESLLSEIRNLLRK
jgi:large conductance mechanosensitive channel